MPPLPSRPGSLPEQCDRPSSQPVLTAPCGVHGANSPSCDRSARIREAFTRKESSVSRMWKTAARLFFSSTRLVLIPSCNTGPNTQAERLWDTIYIRCPLTVWQRAAACLARASEDFHQAQSCAAPSFPHTSPPPGPGSDGATGSPRQRTARAASAGLPPGLPIPARPRAARGPRWPRGPPAEPRSVRPLTGGGVRVGVT